MALLRPVGSARNPFGSIETMIESESATRNGRRKERRSAIRTSHVKKKGSETRNEEIESEVKTMNEEADSEYHYYCVVVRRRFLYIFTVCSYVVF